MKVCNNKGNSVGLLIDDVNDHVICGLLLCLRQLIPLVTMEIEDALLLPKMYCLLLRCCLHSNHNVVTSALEALSVLLWKPVPSLIVWLTKTVDHMMSSICYDPLIYEFYFRENFCLPIFRPICENHCARRFLDVGYLYSLKCIGLYK